MRPRRTGPGDGDVRVRAWRWVSSRGRIGDAAAGGGARPRVPAHLYTNMTSRSVSTGRERPGPANARKRPQPGRRRAAPASAGVYDRLRRLIVRGRLPPGERVTE